MSAYGDLDGPIDGEDIRHQNTAMVKILVPNNMKIFPVNVPRAFNTHPLLVILLISAVSEVIPFPNALLPIPFQIIHAMNSSCPAVESPVSRI